MSFGNIFVYITFLFGAVIKKNKIAKFLYPSHETICLNDYCKITIICIKKRDLPPVFVAQQKMILIQLSHFVSLHDCSLALSPPAVPALRWGPFEVLITASVLLDAGRCLGVWGHDGSTPNVIRLLRLFL